VPLVCDDSKKCEKARRTKKVFGQWEGKRARRFHGKGDNTANVRKGSEGKNVLANFKKGGGEK